MQYSAITIEILLGSTAVKQAEIRQLQVKKTATPISEASTENKKIAKLKATLSAAKEAKQRQEAMKATVAKQKEDVDAAAATVAKQKEDAEHAAATVREEKNAILREIAFLNKPCNATLFVEGAGTTFINGFYGNKEGDLYYKLNVDGTNFFKWVGLSRRKIQIGENKIYRVGDKSCCCGYEFYYCWASGYGGWR